jgi:CRP-like cAMP-binding protein
MAVVLSEILDIPFFRELAEKVEPVLLQSLVGKCSRKHYPSNRIVFRQGEPADSIYIVEEGRVQFLT